MWKRSLVIVLAGVIAVFLVAAVVTAQGWPGTWVSSFQVMNLGEDTANILVEYYEENGTWVEDATHSYSVAVGSAINLYQPNIEGLPSGFKGSAVVRADQRVAAIGSEQTTYADGSIGNSQYSGFGDSDIGTVFYLPNVNRGFGGGGWSSRITIQNTESSEVTAKVTFYNSDGTEEDVDEVTLNGNGSTTLLQVDDDELPTNWLGTAIVDATEGATGNIAVIVDVMSEDGRVETYNGFTSGAQTMYLPTLLLDFGANRWNTSFQVLNIGSATSAVTMTYYTAGSVTPAKQVTTSLGRYKSVNRYQPNDDSDLGSNWIGSVVVESEEPVVVVGSQSSSAAGTELASIYSGAPAGASEAVLPTILLNFGGSNYVTSFQVMNVGNADASVRLEYYEPGNPTPVKTVYYDGALGNEPKIAPYTSVNRYQPNVDSDLGVGWQGSVRVISDEPVVVLGSQNGLGREGDAAGQYNGIVASQ